MWPRTNELKITKTDKQKLKQTSAKMKQVVTLLFPKQWGKKEKNLQTTRVNGLAVNDYRRSDKKNNKGGK